MGWQPSRFLADWAEAERAYALAERLGSVNAAAKELGTTWPSLRKAFTHHGLGMPTPNPEAVRQRAIAAARQRTGQPATPSLDPVFAALNPGALPARERSPAELYQWVRRESSTPSWVPAWSSSCTAKAGPASPPPGPGRSSAATNAPTATPATVRAVASAGRPTVPAAATAPADPTNPRRGDGCRCPLIAPRPEQS